MTTRRALTTLDKLKIMVRQAVCPDCGEDDLDNLRAKHIDCHAKKTARDAAARAKVKRITGTTEAIEAVAASLSGTPSPIPGDTTK